MSQIEQGIDSLEHHHLGLLTEHGKKNHIWVGENTVQQIFASCSPDTPNLMISTMPAQSGEARQKRRKYKAEAGNVISQAARIPLATCQLTAL
jgi:hypothetical protein